MWYLVVKFKNVCIFSESILYKTVDRRYSEKLRTTYTFIVCTMQYYRIVNIIIIIIIVVIIITTLFWWCGVCARIDCRKQTVYIG